MVQYFGRHAQQAAPYFSSKTGKPVTLDELQAIFPMELIQQEIPRRDGLTFRKK